MPGLILPGFYAVLQLLLLIAVGFITRRTGIWPDDFFTGLSRFVVRVALPLYFVARLSTTRLTDLEGILIMPIAALIITAVALVISILVFRASPHREESERAGIAMASFGNSGYMPLTFSEVLPTAIPVIAATVSSDEVAVLIAAFLLVYSPMLWSVGNIIITRRSSQDARPRLRQLISPPLIGIVIGLGLSVAGVPALMTRPDLPVVHIVNALTRLSAVTLPLALVNLGAMIGGLQITRADIGRYLGVALRVIAVRYMILPSVFFAALVAGALEGVGQAALLALFLESTTPPATNLSLMAGQAGVNKDHAAVTLLLSYIAYLVVMPIAIVLFLRLTLQGG